MKYGFIGCGNMGGAIAARLSESTKDIAVSDRSGKARKLAERLGIRYADIHRYIREGTCGDPETDEKIRRKEQANLHKRRMPVTLDPFAKGADA